MKYCSATDTWTTIGASGASTFDTIGSGTNTTAAMVLGAGSSLATSGGTNQATSLTGIANGAIAVGTASNLSSITGLTASASLGFRIPAPSGNGAALDVIGSADAGHPDILCLNLPGSAAGTCDAAKVSYTGALTAVSGTFGTGNTGTVSLGTLTLNGATSGSASIGVAAVAGTPSRWLMPTSDPTNGQQLQAGTPSGGTVQLSWVSNSSTPGADTLDPTMILQRDDFCSALTTTGNIGQLGWQFTVIGTTGLTISQAQAALPDACNVIGTTSATTGRGGTIYLNTPEIAWGTSSNDWTLKFRVKISSTTSVQYFVGVGANLSAVNNVNFMGMRYDTASDAAFKFCTTKTSTSTCHATTFTADTNFHTITLSWTASTSTVNFQFDGGAAICLNSGGTGGCTADANIPTVTTLWPGIQLVENSATQPTITMSYFGMKISGLSR